MNIRGKRSFLKNLVALSIVTILLFGAVWLISSFVLREGGDLTGRDKLALIKIEGIISIEPQLGRINPADGKMYSAKMQKVFICP